MCVFTDLMCHGEGGVKPVVLDDCTAPLRRAHGSHISHTESITGVMTAQILHTAAHTPTFKPLNHILNQLLFLDFLFSFNFSLYKF